MNPSRIVITGSIGSGKSTVSQIIRDLGFKVIDSDKVNKKLLEKGGDNFNAIKNDPDFSQVFHGDILDKKVLAKLIFSDPKLMDKLNKITHPNIIKTIEDEIEKTKDPYVFIEIPLYYQMPIRFRADKVIFVESDKHIQAQRLASRDDIDHSYAIEKINKQEDLVGERDTKEIIIKNNETLADLKKNIKTFLKAEKIL